MVKLAESRTESAARDLLEIRGWNLSRPPKGNVLWKHEYRDYPDLEQALVSASKSGKGAGYPEFIVVDTRARPLMVVEAKAHSRDINKASKEAAHYANALTGGGGEILAVGVAGSDEEEIAVSVRKKSGEDWLPIEYQKSPIQWLPTFEETSRLLANPDLFALDPEVPPADVMEARADEINRILRECRISDARRPAVMAAFMLAMWQSKGKISLDPEYVLLNVNSACKKAFADAGKLEIADSIAVDPANDELQHRARHIIKILRLLNVTTLTSAHDYLGQLYEHFFRYTGGNTIGQFFTPRHVTRFMADVCDVREQDVVVDPTCGTGGFLIACLHRMIGLRKMTREQVKTMVRGHLYGFESEPVTAGMCVANMILRGDGTTGVVKGDCFTEDRFPVGQATIVLGNPPFPHKKDDAQPERFVDRALEALRERGEMAMVLPASLLVKGGTKSLWRKSILKKNSLLGVIQLPDELFQPYAAVTTNILILRKGVAHDPKSPVFWARIGNDGYKLKKSVRVEQAGEQLSETLDAYRTRKAKPGWYAWEPVGGLDWSPGAHIASAPANEDEVRSEVETMLRSEASLHAFHAPGLAATYRHSESLPSFGYGKLTGRKPFTLSDEPSSLGHWFNIYYGLKELHSKENLEPGDTMVISSSGEYNGCYGFFKFDARIKPPFATVPATGSIGECFVQRLACGVTDDCLLLIPKSGTPSELLYVAAAVVRLEKWRFSYGRKITPARMAHFKLPQSASLRKWINLRAEENQRLNATIVSSLASESATEERFGWLLKDWLAGRPRGMNVTDMTSHPSYQRIISLGSVVVPLILKELSNRPDHWFVALHAITGANPVGPSSEGKIKKMAADWMEWGRQQGYIS